MSTIPVNQSIFKTGHIQNQNAGPSTVVQGSAFMATLLKVTVIAATLIAAIVAFAALPILPAIFITAAVGGGSLLAASCLESCCDFFSRCCKGRSHNSTPTPTTPRFSFFPSFFYRNSGNPPGHVPVGGGHHVPPPIPNPHGGPHGHVQVGGGHHVPPPPMPNPHGGPHGSRGQPFPFFPPPPNAHGGASVHVPVGGRRH